MSDRKQPNLSSPRALRRLSRLFIVLLLPLLFISSAIRLEMNSLGLYERGFEKFEISTSSHLDNAQLSEIAQRLIGYFNSTYDSPQMLVTSEDGTEFALYHDYELVHLADVKTLFELNSTVQSILLLFIVVLVLAAFSGHNPGWKREITKSLKLGATLSLLSLLLASILFAADFSWMFVGFHLVAFNNSFWLLDPNRDYLVILFPLGFWEDMFLLAGILTAAFATATLAIPRILHHITHQDGSQSMAIER